MKMKKGLSFIVLSILVISVFSLALVSAFWPFDLLSSPKVSAKVTSGYGSDYSASGSSSPASASGSSSPAPSSGGGGTSSGGSGSSTSECLDSDKGKDYFNSGSIKYKDYTFSDKCYGNVLYEKYCSNGLALTVKYSCLNGCSNGACVSGTTNTNSGSGSSSGYVGTGYGGSSNSGSSGGGGGSISTNTNRYSTTCTYTWDSSPYVGQTVRISASINDSLGKEVSDSVNVGVKLIDSNGASGSGSSGGYSTSGGLNIHINTPRSDLVKVGKIEIKVSSSGPNVLGPMSLGFSGKNDESGQSWGGGFQIPGEYCISSSSGGGGSGSGVVILKYGEGSKSVTFNGKTYRIYLSSIGLNSVQLQIDGKYTDVLSEGQTYSIGDGNSIYIKDIAVQDYAGGIKQVSVMISSSTSTSPICIDSDGGYTPNITGYVLIGEKIVNDECVVDAISINPGYLKEAVCDVSSPSGFKLSEIYCSKGCRKGSCNLPSGLNLNDFSEKVLLNKLSRKVYFGEPLSVSYHIINDKDMSNLLADGKITLNNGGQVEYSQRIILGDGAVFESSGPYSYILNLSKPGEVYSIQVHFVELVSPESIIGSNITLFGEEYVISQASFSRLTLISKNSTNVIDLNGTIKKYSWQNIWNAHGYISTSGGAISGFVIILADGEYHLEVGEVYMDPVFNTFGLLFAGYDYEGGERDKLYANVYLVSNVTTSSPASCTDSDGGANYYVNGTLSNGTNIYRDSCIDDRRVSEGVCKEGVPIDDAFNSWIAYSCPNGCSNGACIQSTTPTTGEKIKVIPKGDYVILEDFPLKDSVEDIAIAYGSGGIFKGNGKGEYDLLRISTDDRLTFDADTDKYFIASWKDSGNKNAESYLMRATNFKRDNGVNRATFEYRKNGVWVTFANDRKSGDLVRLGNVDLTLENVSYEGKNVTIVSPGRWDYTFQTIYSKEGMRVYLPSVVSEHSYNVTFIPHNSSGSIGFGKPYVTSFFGWVNGVLRIENVTTFPEIPLSEGEAIGSKVFTSYYAGPPVLELLWDKRIATQPLTINWGASGGNGLSHKYIIKKDIGTADYTVGSLEEGLSAGVVNFLAMQFSGEINGAYASYYDEGVGNIGVSVLELDHKVNFSEFNSYVSILEKNQDLILDYDSANNEQLGNTGSLPNSQILGIGSRSDESSGTWMWTSNNKVVLIAFMNIGDVTREFIGAYLRKHPSTLILPEEEGPVLSCENGCALDGKCYPFGYRKGGQYCSDISEFLEQRANEAKCENSFECANNICSSGKCFDVQELIEENRGMKVLLTQMLCKLQNLFDDEGYQQCLIDKLGGQEDKLVIEKNFGDLKWEKTETGADADVVDAIIEWLGIQGKPNAASAFYNGPEGGIVAGVIDGEFGEGDLNRFLDSVFEEIREETDHQVDLDIEHYEGRNYLFISVTSNADKALVLVWYTDDKFVVIVDEGFLNDDEADLIKEYADRYPSEIKSEFKYIPSPGPGAFGGGSGLRSSSASGGGSSGISGSSSLFGGRN